MKLLSLGDIEEWCRTRGVLLTSDRTLQFDGPEAGRTAIGLDEPPARLIALMDYLLPTWEGARPGEAMIWVREHGIWAEHSERFGTTLARLIRATCGQPCGLGERPGQLFSSHEALEAQVFAFGLICCGWDAYIVPEAAGTIYFASHHGTLTALCRTQEDRDEVVARLSEWGPTSATRNPLGLGPSEARGEHGE